MKTMFLALAAAVAVPAAALVAQPAPVAPVHHGMGASGHAARVHTRAEVVGHVRTMFGRLDANRDGFLTRAEAQAGRAMHGQRMRAGGVRQPGAGSARAFERFDVNRDGAISRAEWDARTAQRQQRRAAQGQRVDGVAKARGMGLPGMGLRGRMFEAADVDRDSRVSMAEAQNAALQRFDRLDSNRDGNLTPEERRHGRQLMRAQRQRG